MKPANGVEEGHSGLEPTLFAPRLGKPFSAPELGMWEDWLVPASVVCRGTGLRIWRQLARLGSAGSSQGTQRNFVGQVVGLLRERAFWGPAENQFGKDFQR